MSLVCMLTVTLIMERELKLLSFDIQMTIILAKITAAQIEIALSYHKVCEIYFLAAIFAATK